MHTLTHAKKNHFRTHHQPITKAQVYYANNNMAFEST